ncbi:DUF998 domain-containing protein [Streptomyces sp.]|uniref:DUF998 domain-containing protein n=2 Tax=Streptomyces sp. TaxID=1931 RepID=UPI0028124B11|nr:DUF998 domain-containing protein [Streptomyces sp.]
MESAGDSTSPHVHAQRPGADTALPAAGVAAATALAVAGVLYNSWVLEAVLPTGLDPRHAYVSELYATGQPFRRIFGTAEVICAVLLGWGAWRSRAGWASSRTEAGGWWALVGFAVWSLADVAVPMGCAPSAEDGCRAVHPWHTVTSALVHLCLFASMALLVTAARRGRRGLEPVGRWGPWLLGGALVSALGTVGALLGLAGWHGVAQRVHLLLVGLWFLLLAGAVARDGHRWVSRTGTPSG